MKYAGIDLHSNNSVVCVINENDRVLVKKRVGNDLERVAELLEAHRQQLCGVVVESTYNWYWLVDGLQELGFVVHLANACAVRTYSGLKYADDDSDARHLAHLLRLGVLPCGHIYPREQRGLRDLSRQRMRLVQQRSRQIIAIENTLSRERGAGMSANQVKRLSDDDVTGLGLREEVTLSLQALLAVMRVLDAQIELLERRLQQGVRIRDEYRVLLSTPGIGQTLGTAIMLETGDVERFEHVGDYASYARCVGSVHLSNGKKKGEGNTKSGNRYLAWAFVEAAQFARRNSDPAKRFYERKKARTNTTVATKALAHKLARACYHMLKTGKPFDEARCFA
jgi:transposase